MKKIGIIQGRLSRPTEGFQDCPVKWEDEFEALPELGLNHIEWVITKERYFENPIHTINLQSYNISSVCVDFMVDKNFLNDEIYWEHFNNICQRALLNEIPFITIPLLEGSSVVSPAARRAFIARLQRYILIYPSLKFSIEAELSANDLLEIVDLSPNIYVTYDTGNLTSLGVNHTYYIDQIQHKINNVHLKDRDRAAQSYLPGLGETDFPLILNELKKIGYDSLYTLQTARGIEGEEKQTILNHKNYFKEIYNVS